MKSPRNLAKRSLYGIISLLALGITIGLVLWSFTPVQGKSGASRLFDVRKGESATIVAERLFEEGLIRSILAFRIAAKIEGREGGLKTGTYRVDPGMNALAILDLLGNGRQVLIKVTLPEGLTLRQSALMLEESGIVDAESFLKLAENPSFLHELGIPASNVEGYLFPDTYFMPKNLGPEATIRLMVSTLHDRVNEIPGADGLDAKALHQVIILASIVEREYRLPAEAPLMSSVFANRLRIGMPLQSCATVVYVITEHLGKPHPETVYDRDLKIDDPYNTYIHPGLPPGPISNPGLVALKAALFHPTTAWLYFRLVDQEAGSHRFSTTLEEHIEAAKLFIKRSAGK